MYNIHLALLFKGKNAKNTINIKQNTIVELNVFIIIVFLVYTKQCTCTSKKYKY